MVKFRRVGIAYKKVIYSKGEGGGVDVVAEKHGGGGFSLAVLGEKGSWDRSPDWGRSGTVFKTSQKRKGLPWEWRRKGRRPIFVREGREMEDTSMRTDSGEGRTAPR